MPTELKRTISVVESSEGGVRGERGQFSNYLSVPNIILLGDPGSGKTHTFKAAAETETSQYYTVREFLVCGDNIAGSDTIYLDGLDEYRSRSDGKNLIFELIQLLNRQGHPKIRLSCRSADWLGESDLTLFRKYFGDLSYVVLNLEPLSEEEISIILDEKGVSNPITFIDRARFRSMENLLGNPQTLLMLADVVLNDAWPDTRKELFEKSCSLLLEEINREHARSGQGIFSSEDLLEPSGATAAALLISGMPGISLLPGMPASSDFPSYKTLCFQQGEKIQACLMRRCFSYIDSEYEAVTYIHRTVAEFLGARWLAGKVRAGHSLSRVQSLIGKGGYPASELRGLYAWLPVFLPEHAELFIRNDPYGVLMYGDAASLAPSHRTTLLSSLVQLSDTDPWFRAGEWSDNQLGSLSGPDMVDSFQDILLSQDSSFHLRSLILGAIANGPDLAQLRDVLLNIVMKGTIYHETALAIEALLKVVPDEKQRLVEIFHSTLKQDAKTARLRGKILSCLYKENFQPEDVLAVCNDVLHDTKQHAIGELWNMAAAFPEMALPEILDTLCALDIDKKFYGERVNQHIVKSVFERLLQRLLQTDFMPQPKRMWQWLTTLLLLSRRHGTSGDTDISLWLRQNPSLVFEMLLSAFEKTEEKTRRLSWSDFEKITMRSLVGGDLARMIFKDLEEKTTLTELDHYLYEKCGPQVFWGEPEGVLELLKKFQSLAAQYPDLQSVCEACCQCEIDDWRLEDIEMRLKQKQKKERQRAKTQHNLEKTKEQISTGVHLNNIGFLARIYFGDFSDVDLSLSPVDRLCETVGENYVNLALSGFSAILERDDLPTPYDVALSLAENKYRPWWYAVLAGITEAWLRQGESLEGFSDDLLKSALAIATEFPANSEGDKDKRWQQQLLDERLDIVEFVYEEIARIELKHKKTHILVLYFLQHNKETKNWRSRVALRLLKQFPCSPPGFLKSLVLAGIYKPNYRDALLEQAKHGIVSCGGEQREVWLIIGFLLEPALFSGLLKKYSKRNDMIVWNLQDLSQQAVIKETDQSLQLSVSQIECCVLITGSAFENVSRPSETVGDQNPWDATEFVRENINKLAANPARESTEALKRLIADNSLASYHDHLRHSLANQAVVRRGAEYRQPSWTETIESLKGGRPANINDLHALLVDQLQIEKEEIQYSNTDGYKAFWRCDRYGKVDRPEIENICRNRLIERLKLSLIPLDLHVEPEGSMASDKRADIIVYGSGSMKLPLELKRDFHADLWTACENQLERMYARDPEAAGYGIYVVFWFGKRRTRPIAGQPAGIKKPESAAELEIALQSLVAAEQATFLRVIVLDVTSPY